MDEKEIQMVRKKNDRKVLMKGFWSDLRKTKFCFKDFIIDFITFFIAVMVASKIIDLFAFETKILSVVFEILIIALAVAVADVLKNFICILFNNCNKNL